MSEAIKWSELSNKDKIKLILEHLYNCYFVENEHFVDRNRGKLPKDFHWPIAWWDEMIECWWTRDIRSNWNTDFDPLRSMNDALQIVQSHKFMEVKLEYAEGWKSETERWQTFVCTVDPYDGVPVSASGCTMMDVICIAALMACGVEIEI